MSINIVQTPEPWLTDDQTDTSLTGSWDSPPTSSNYGLWLLVVNENGGQRTITSEPTGWTLIADVDIGAQHQHTYIYKRVFDGTANDTPSVTISPGAHMGAYPIELASNVLSADEIIALAENFSNSAVTTFSTGTTGTPTQNNGRAIAFFGLKNLDATISSPTNGFVIQDQVINLNGTATTDADRITMGWATKEITDGLATSCSVTSSLTRRYAAQLIIVGESASAPIEQAITTVTETGTSITLTGTKSLPIVMVLEDDDAISVGGSVSQSINVVIEQDSAATALTTDSFYDLTAVEEVSTAMALTHLRSLGIVVAIETDNSINLQQSHVYPMQGSVGWALQREPTDEFYPMQGSSKWD